MDLIATLALTFVLVAVQIVLSRVVVRALARLRRSR
jgi:hypothetical protein